MLLVKQCAHFVSGMKLCHVLSNSDDSSCAVRAWNDILLLRKWILSKWNNYVSILKHSQFT
mgnify:CR=1 FL=1